MKDNSLILFYIYVVLMLSLFVQCESNEKLEDIEQAVKGVSTEINMLKYRHK